MGSFYPSNSPSKGSEEPRFVVKNCRPCRLWAVAPPQPSTSASAPSHEGEEVESDFVFFEGASIYHFLGR